MGKIVNCAEVDPRSGCAHVVRGANEEQLLRNAEQHAKEHGIVEATPELMQRVKQAMRDE